MTTSPAGIALIKEFEGCRLTAYQDGAGVWTIGYGHTSGMQSGETCTQEQAESWLVQDLRIAESGVTRYAPGVAQCQFDALVSFCFNLGIFALEHSTLLKLLLADDVAGAAAEFPRWDHVAGKESAGLLRRRMAEQTMFLGEPQVTK